ncbi:glycosyltransferase family 4 protein [Tabrizicola sp.]|uniref:glycosyltransferase family 4 protein n=1 Tax=Tabrizicola sp. TaxID=2005166 RepID=UPI002735F3EB|nr:glycosyltransferase family 4 protein [Tabrizicola sp.]MDP3194731.1 glycosyltransferase family 4 protein [Tabrizicola sp.]
MSLPPAARPLRIGLLTPAWPGTATANGIASATAHLAQGLGAIGHEVTILTGLIDGPHRHPRVVQLAPLPFSLPERLTGRFFPDRGLRGVNIRKLILGAQQAITDHNIEVLLMEESYGWAGAVRAALQIPVVATLHGPQWLHRVSPAPQRRGPEARRESWEQAGLQRVDAIISPSRDVLDRTRAVWGLPEVPTTVIGNAVALPALDRPAAQSTEPRLLFIGRFDRIKGADILLDAFSRIAATRPDARLTFVGPDIGIPQPDGSRLHLAQALARLPVATRDRIEVLGHRTRDEIAELRRHYPITLIASRYETFGVALIEALAAGSAVVATRAGGCAEILRDGETGLLVPSEDAAAMADACLRLLTDPALVLRLGQAARADVEKRFTPEVIAREVATFLARICRS